MFGFDAGFRVSDVVNLLITDINGKEHLVLIRQAKGKQDRFNKIIFCHRSKI